MIFRPSLTKLNQQNFDPHNRLSGTATQIQQKSSQTESEVISQQIFQISTPNLVCTWKTLQHVPMCKGNFISSKMIDIKHLYCSVKMWTLLALNGHHLGHVPEGEE